MNSLLSDSGVVAPFPLRRNSEMINCPAVATLGLSTLSWPAADTRRLPATDTHSRHTPSAERHQRVIEPTFRGESVTRWERRGFYHAGAAGPVSRAWAG